MNDINIIYWFNGILCTFIYFALMAILILWGERVNEPKKGCGGEFYSTPDPLTCGQMIRTNKGKERWYCNDCLDKGDKK